MEVDKIYSNKITFASPMSIVKHIQYTSLSLDMRFLISNINGGQCYYRLGVVILDINQKIIAYNTNGK